MLFHEHTASLHHFTASPFLNCVQGSDPLVSLKSTDFMWSCMGALFVYVHMRMHTQRHRYEGQRSTYGPTVRAPEAELRSGLVEGTPAESSHQSNCNSQIMEFKSWESKQRWTYYLQSSGCNPIYCQQVITGLQCFPKALFISKIKKSNHTQRPQKWFPCHMLHIIIFYI